MDRRVLLLFVISIFSYASADTLSWDTLRKYFMYSLSAYCSSEQGLSTWTCPWCTFVPIPPATDITTFETPGFGMKGLYGYVGRTNESIIIAFRGSETTQNWIVDFEFTQTNYTPVSNARVHVGFYENYKQVSKVITPAVIKLQAAYPELSVISTGYSLGAALSLLNGAGLVEAGVKNVEVWNFGQPRVGNAVFAKYANSIINTIYRVVNIHDIVPHVPPMGLPDEEYHHEATEVWFPTNHTTYVVCDSTGEDPKCADSINPLKYNVTDHEDYLGYGSHGIHPSKGC